MCGLTSGDAQSSSGGALYQCIYEVFSVMSFTVTKMLKNSYIRLYREALKRTRTEYRSKS